MPNGIPENFVRTFKSAITAGLSDQAYNLDTLERITDNFLLQYRNASQATTKTSPAQLFKGRHLRANLQCVDTADIIFYRGNTYQSSKGIVTRKLGNRMVEIIDLPDGSIHRRHLDQIRQNNISQNVEVEQPYNSNASTSPKTADMETNTTDIDPQQQAEASRRSGRVHNQPNYYIRH